MSDAAPSPAAAPAPAPPNPLSASEPWDLVAGSYAKESLPYFLAFARDALVHVPVAPGDRVLDVACGPGTLSLLAAAAGARVSAIDFSEPMIAQLRDRAAVQGLADAVDVRSGDGQRLPFPTASFDAAFSMFGLMFFPDRQAGLRELARVLEPGRPALVSSWVPFAGPFGAIMTAAKELLPGLPFGGGGTPPLGTPDEIRNEMTAAGFRTVTVETVLHQLTCPSFDAFWDMMVRVNAPLVLIQHRVGAARWAEVAPVIKERVRQTVDDGPVLVGRGAYFGIGRT